uniref:Uncharacterized protein n=1 Tax=Anguilla anguilla TaxID=7936 RepID=A0A0E9PNH3_ANGAN
MERARIYGSGKVISSTSTSAKTGRSE